MATKSTKKSPSTSGSAIDTSLAKAAASAPKPKKAKAKKPAPAAQIAPSGLEIVEVVAHSAADSGVQEASAKPAKKKRAAAKPRTAKVAIKGESGTPLEIEVPEIVPVTDPVGDVSDGEAQAAVEPGEARAMAQAMVEEIHADELPEFLSRDTPDDANDSKPESASEAKLERLQKILSKAGIASRRHAEEMIVGGRVMVNGQFVTQLGAKADPARDHIRVDGKLIAGAERHRYFVLNKPRGYVTTASDPEGRPTVMQLFGKLHERLYPVGRLDYLSEGLLLVTNDGELANQLTRAASAVEKTYVVKVAGQPTEDELERLRSGVSIERGERGSPRVSSAPAQVREIRRGDNPWFEVVLIEGRNRELRKMFEQIGHHVEKIRRVAYGPLVLDIEPGKFRELTPEEVKALQLTADGKLKPRRPRASQLLPKDAGKPAEDRETKRGNRKPFARQSEQRERPFRRDARPEFKPRFENDRPKRFEGTRPNRFSGPAKREDFGGPKREGFGSRPQRSGSDGPGRFGPEKRGPFLRKPDQFGARSQRPRPERGERRESRSFGDRGAESNRFQRPDRGRENFESAPKQRFENRGTSFRPQQRSNEREDEGPARRAYDSRGDRPQFRRPDRPFNKRSNAQPERPRFDLGERPASNRPDRPAFDRGSKPAFRRENRPAFNREHRPGFKPGDRRDQRPGSRPAKPWVSKPTERKPGELTLHPPAKRFSSRAAGGPPAGNRSFSRSPGSRGPGSRGPGKPAFRPGGKPGSRPGGRKRD
ncbi:MAG TPA: pseudouridine synthase [Terracidiphilus sp.]|nr:pseudouridine synthase [Terracidiphilus sp.]